MGNKRLVYLEGGLTVHPLYGELTGYPPDGYTFTAGSGTFTRTMEGARKFEFLTALQLLLEMRVGVPVALLKAQLLRFKKPPEGTALTFACLHPVFRKEPWIMDLEFLHTLISNDPFRFRRYKNLLERVFRSHFCRKILPWSEASKKTLIDNLDCGDFDDKIEVVPLAVRTRNFVKSTRPNGPVKLLFVGSAHSPGGPRARALWFALKGGREVVEAFLQLNRLYQNLELIIRSEVPFSVKEVCEGIPNIRLLQSVVPRSDLEREYEAADIFMLPAYHTPFTVLLDAMSYELPIIASNVFATPEIVLHGRTGLLVRKPERLTYIADGLPSIRTPQFLEDMAEVDQRVVDDLVGAAKTLIENPELRRSLGRAARREIEEGRFSIGRRNTRLRQIFDEASDVSHQS
jgi:glycosyltransferase involved in cell wall biosynthesis